MDVAQVMSETIGSALSVGIVSGLFVVLFPAALSAAVNAIKKMLS